MPRRPVGHILTTVLTVSLAACSADSAQDAVDVSSTEAAVAVPTSGKPTTSTSSSPTTSEPNTAAPTTETAVSAAQTSTKPPTATPSTAKPTTGTPTTAAPTTAKPTTAAPTTAAPTTATPTTAAPTSAAPAPSQPPNPGDTKNCSDFSSYAAAKSWFDTYYPYYGDVARLDQDGDRIPCESLPGAPG